MNHAEHPSDQDFENASSTISEGLKSCRAVLSGYRSLLSAEPNAHVASNDDGFADLGREDVVG